MTTQERNQMLAGLLEQGVIDEQWLEHPCKIAHSSPNKPRTAVWVQWLTVAGFIAIAVIALALVLFVAMNSGEL